MRLKGSFLRRMAGAALIAGMPLLANAQAQGAQPEFEPAPSALGCATGTEANDLAYPEGKAELRLGAILRVRLTFRAPDKAPEAEVFFDTAGDPFRAAVLRHVARYRLPCMAPGAPALVVTREFVFTADDGRTVHWDPLRDEQGTSRPEFAACVTGADRPPSYPYSKIDRVSRGIVLIRFSFAGPDKPPEVEVAFNGGSPRFARVVEDYASGYRMPCMRPGDSPDRGTQAFSFMLEGDAGSLLRDSSLKDFLAVLKLSEERGRRFDFNTMGCPFDVRFVLRRPYLPNAVGEVDKPDANRREFVEWLKRVEFNVRAAQRSQLIGSAMTVSVPCTVLELT